MSKITASAIGESCTVRIPNVCNHDVNTVKECITCKEIKKIEHFEIRKEGKYLFRRGECKLCVKKRALLNRKKNIEDRKRKDFEYHIKNKEKRNALVAKWRVENKEKYEAGAEKYRKENAEIRAKKAVEWRKNNKEIQRLQSQIKRARKSSVGGKLSKNIVEKLLIIQKGRCACCGVLLKNNYQIDHIMPISLGGQNVDSNVQLLTAFCNNSKHAKHPIEYMQKKGFLL